MKVKILVMDVDGTLTDGKIFLSTKSEIMKVFDVKDGYAISRLNQFNIVPVIITGRSSEILIRRCEEIGIKELYQGVTNKKSKLKEVCETLEVSPSECAYIGDDIVDMECMKLCGLSACPSDAANEIIKCVDYVCKAKGGAGAVREFCDYIIKHINNVII